jgi:23S rRNA pseudouridine2457 synthase
LVVVLISCCVLLTRAFPAQQSNNEAPSVYSYIVLYKPALMLCSFSDDGPRALQKNRPCRPTLADLNGLPKGMHTVGRLDRDSEGLLLLTDNGQFTQQVHSQAAKVYWALVTGVPSESALDEMRQGGLLIRGVLSQPPVAVQRLPGKDEAQTTTSTFAELLLLPPAVPGMDRLFGNSWIEITLREGRNRQVRRITKAAGHPTLRLVRVAIGSLNLQNTELELGQWKIIDKQQVLL